MTTLRRIGLFAAALAFCACLAGFAFLAGLHSLFTSPQPLKNALDRSGIYEEITPNIAEQQLAAAALPTHDMGIKTALKQSLPAAFYHQASEKIIDGTYSWMSGGAAAPEFSISTTAVKTSFATNVAGYVRGQMDALPACERDTPPPVSAQDALSLTCLPKHVTPDAVANAAQQQLLASSLFAGDTITPAMLKDGKGRTFKEQFAFLPPLYRSYVPALVILPLIAAICGAGIVFSSASKRRGMRRIAWITLSLGLVTLVLAAAGSDLFAMGVRIFGLPGSLAFETQDKLVRAIELIAADARPWWLGVDAGYVLLGAGLIAGLWMRRPKASLRFSSHD